jgi:hypothetical protein
MSNRLQGVVNSWHEEKCWGTIRVGSKSSLERYWLHQKFIRSGTATPAPGMECFFEVDESTVGIEGKLPKAIRVDIIVPDVAEEAVNNDVR